MSLGVPCSWLISYVVAVREVETRNTDKIE